VAARGLDVPNLGLVVNYDLPRSVSDFRHRIGRTGRANNAGTAITFVSEGKERFWNVIWKKEKLGGGADVRSGEVVTGFELDEELWEKERANEKLEINVGDINGGIKGKGKSKKDKLREKAKLSLSRGEAVKSLLLGVGGVVGSIALVDEVRAEDSFSGERNYIQEYPDFTKERSGVLTKQVSCTPPPPPHQTHSNPPPSSFLRHKQIPPNGKIGTTAAGRGDRVVFDWSGYTIGYFGRPFQAKGGPKGGAFDKEIDFSRCVIGDGKVVKGLEEAFVGMKSGEGKQVLIPSGSLSYLSSKEDNGHAKVGPAPTTFSGQRALDFVLDNPRLDRTILINVKVVRVDKRGGGSFVKGD